MTLISQPEIPDILAYALRVNIENLRPWEYDNMEADLYEGIVYCQNIYHRERRYAIEDRDNMRKAKEAAEAQRKQGMR